MIDASDGKRDFFVSFNQADRAWATWIAWALEGAGYSVFFQDWDFKGNFVLEMDKAHRQSRRSIAVLSPDYLTSRFAAPEWAARFAQDATSEHDLLLPVRVRPCQLEGLLAQIIYVDLVGCGEEAARDKLLRRVEGIRLKPDEPPLFPGEINHAVVPERPAFPGYTDGWAGDSTEASTASGRRTRAAGALADGGHRLSRPGSGCSDRAAGFRRHQRHRDRWRRRGPGRQRQHGHQQRHQAVSRWQAALAAGLVALALGSTPAWPLGDTEVTATDCGIAAGRDASNNTVTCTYGLRPEQVKELTKAAARGATGPLTETIVALSKQLGVTESATKTLLRIVGERDVPLEQLTETLAKVANDYKRLQTQAAALNPDNPTARDLVKQAEAEITAGHFPKAHQLLGAATQAQIAAAQQDGS
jgi:hypothetical protein